MGAGSAMGRRAVDGVFGAFSGSSGGSDAAHKTAEVPVQKAPLVGGGACDFDQSQFIQCMQDNKGSSSSCDHYYAALQQCQAKM